MGKAVFANAMSYAGVLVQVLATLRLILLPQLPGKVTYKEVWDRIPGFWLQHGQDLAVFVIWGMNQHEMLDSISTTNDSLSLFLSLHFFHFASQKIFKNIYIKNFLTKIQKQYFKQRRENRGVRKTIFQIIFDYPQVSYPTSVYLPPKTTRIKGRKERKKERRKDRGKQSHHLQR